ncbi:ATP-dependent Clp protease proteolytic subunit-related protein 4, chloroplastic [Selaginella moellendorffii]|uniref:ATP-dependent Clp protease proteolytic subunit-related protein 4, chloroplastic n=1 Tax=Selaginella moellendorffii TaxID=88036 RepID=UPI000D1C339E|nr:ATP-dependent Clp protease proteolytic subunit-related protein 4, chloroplastic [Selaginella moellendorffii]|eukprot:XP_002993341.2 ATP-dependent Clp protease proteolytic subunit-related protein 4, chloroplastic [Selaginella moellendorffii]
MAGLSSLGQRNWFVCGSSSGRKDGFGGAVAGGKKRLSLGTELFQPLVGGSRCCLFAGQSLSLSSPLLSSTKKRGSRGVVTMVIPFVRGDASAQPPPDLPSYLFHNRIVFLGMSLVPAVTELIMAEFLYLQFVDPEKPIYMYINSTGTTKDGEKLGYETEALAMYDTMQYVKPPIFTLCVGNAWGEAALLLAAGAKGNRSALPSTTIMLKEPIAQFRGQATDIDIARREVRNLKKDLVELLERHTGQPADKIEEDIRRPKYFSPDEAVDYGLIDKVLRTEKGEKSKGVVDQLRQAQLLK